MVSHVTGPLATSQQAGFTGELWVVNPVRDEIGDLTCYASIEDLPEPPDASLLALSPERSIETIKSLAAIGAGGAVCMAAGFAELGPSGAQSFNWNYNRPQEIWRFSDLIAWGR